MEVTTQIIPSLAVIPAKAGIQGSRRAVSGELDSRFRGNDLSSYFLYMKSLAATAGILGLAFVKPANAVEGTRETPFVITKDGAPQVMIATVSDAIPSEKTAARELSVYLQKITGGKFVIVDEKDMPANQRAIYVGQTVFAKQHGIPVEKLGAEEAVLQTVDVNLILAGGRPRGTLYAVYGFLEDVLDCRWYTPWCEKTPHLPNCQIRRLNRRFSPAFSYRDQYTHLTDASIYPDQQQWKWFVVRNRWNGDATGRGIWWEDRGNYAQVPLPSGDEVGGGLLPAGPPHSFAWFFPADVWFKEHPEYFSERNGQRTASNGQDGNQLCLTNSDVLRLMIEKVQDRFRKHPNLQRLAVSINDGGLPTLCDCARCRSVAGEEGEAGLLLQFVNAVADAIRTEFPDKYIMTLAYNATALPPARLRPRDNVIVYVCTGLRSGAVYLPKGTQSQELATLVQWAKLSKHVWGWDYVRNDYIPMSYLSPVLWKMDEQIKFVKKTGMDGIFQENELLIEPPMVAEFHEMRMWIAAKLLQYPDRNLDALIADFLNGYYGEAGPHLRQYVEMQRKRRPQWPYQMIDYDYIRDAQNNFDQAEAAVVKNPDALARVRELRINLDVTTLNFRHQIVREYLRRRPEQKYPYRISMLKNRILNTLANTSNPYLLATPPQYRGGQLFRNRCAAREQTKEYVLALCEGKESAPFPEQFKSLPPHRVIDIVAPQLAGSSGLVPDPEAALGLALARMNADELPFPIGIYDSMGRKGVITTVVKPEDVPGPGYHLYKGCRFPLSEWTFVYLTKSWQIQSHLYTLFNPSKPETQWEVYVSAKFTGPAYPHGDPKAPNGLYVDRIILVRAEE